MQGHQGGELTEKGFTQANLIADRLSEIKFKEIYVSDLNRTIQTSEPIINFHLDTKVIYEERIREKCGGVFEGKPIAEAKATAKKLNIPYRNFRPENGECWLDVSERAEQFIKDILLSHVTSKEEEINKILMITHGGFIMEFLNVIRSFKKEEIYEKNDSHNTSLYIIKVFCSLCGIDSKCKCKINSELKESNLKYEFTLYNDYSHLN